MKYLSLTHNEKYLYWKRNSEDFDVVGDILYTYSDSMKLLNMFYLLLIFDNTYKTNRYRLQHVEIFGVVLTNLAFFDGFAYYKREQQDTFIWHWISLGSYSHMEIEFLW